MATAAQLSSAEKRTAVLKWLLALGIPLIVFCVPETASFDHSIKLFLCLTLWGVISFALELLPNAIVAIILPIGYCMLSLTEWDTAFRPWTTNIPWMVLGAFILSNTLERIGLLKRVAIWCIVKTGGTYTGILWGIFLFGMISNIAMPGGFVPVTAAFTYGICKALGITKSKAGAGIMLTGVFATLVPGYFIFDPSNVGILMGTAEMPILYIDYLKQNIIFLPLIPLLVFLLSKLFKSETAIDGKDYYLQEQKALGRVTSAEKKATVIIICLFLYLVSGHEMMYGFLVAAFAGFLPGLQIADNEDLQRVNYPFLFFITGCMTIGMVATELGFGQILADMLFPYLYGLNSTILLVAVWLIAVIVNFLLTPLAAMASLGAPLTQIAQSLGVNPYPVLYAFYQGLDQLLLPYECALYLIPFSYGMMTLGDFMKGLALKMVVAFLYLLLIGIPYWNIIGLL